MQKMNILTLGQGHRKGETFRNGSTKTDRKYIDFIVSGQSLGQLFGLPDLDLIGTFGWTDKKEYEYKKIDEFLGIEKTKLETGRTCFYVCPECGDIECGAITAKIEVTDNMIIWKDFGYENNYTELNLKDYKEVGPFYFEKASYFEVMESLRNP